MADNYATVTITGVPSNRVATLRNWINANLVDKVNISTALVTETSSGTFVIHVGGPNAEARVTALLSNINTASSRTGVVASVTYRNSRVKTGSDKLSGRQ